MESIPEISNKVLTQTVRESETEGLVVRKVFPLNHEPI